MPAGLALLLGIAAAAQVWRLDLSSQPLAAAERPVAEAGAARCADREDGDVLGIAIVVYGRKAGISAWGHTSLRVLVCVSGRLVDEEIEAYRFSRRTFARLPHRHPDSGFATDRATLRRNRGRLYLRIIPDPVDDAHYARELERNREIHELWLPLPPDTARRLWTDLHTRVAAQQRAFQTGSPIPEGRYFSMGRNCTVPVRGARAALDGAGGEASGVYPLRILADLEAHPGVVHVLHPSEHALHIALDAAGSREALAARLQEPIERPRPLLRRRLAARDRFWAAHLARRLGTPQAPALLEPLASLAPTDPPPAASADSL